MSLVPIKTTKSITLKPGEKFILPPNSSVIAITGDLTSTCDNLPTPEALSCYSFQWELEGPNNGIDAWEGGTINSIKVGDVLFPVNGDAYLTDNGGEAKLIAGMSAAGFINVQTALSMLTRRALFSVCFSTTASIAGASYLIITSGDGTKVYIPARLTSTTSATCSCS